MNKTNASRRRRRRGCCFFPLLLCVCAFFFSISLSLLFPLAFSHNWNNYAQMCSCLILWQAFGFNLFNLRILSLREIQRYPNGFHNIAWNAAISTLWHFGCARRPCVRSSVHIHSVVWSVVFPICYPSLALCVTFELKNSSLIFSLGYYSYSQIPFPHFLCCDQCTSAFELQPTGLSERAQTRTRARISTINKRERIPTFRIIDATH